MNPARGYQLALGWREADGWMDELIQPNWYFSLSAMIPDGQYRRRT
jgi:hypothetical protein